MGVKQTLAREIGYIKEDVAKTSRLRVALTPGRRAAVAAIVGVAILVYSLAKWSDVIAGAVAAAAFLAYAFVFVDIDDEARGPRRRR